MFTQQRALISEIRVFFQLGNLMNIRILVKMIEFLTNQGCEEFDYLNQRITFTTPNALSGSIKIERNGNIKEIIDGVACLHKTLESLKQAWLKGSN